ncbi:26S proteasome non-ATPase regulatory subunit 2 A [Glycine soja]
MLHACFDIKAIMLGKYHYVLYFLILAMQPRMMWIVDENIKPLSLSVCVGQAVNVVGQAGHPKTITGFQTHYTPVLLSAGDKAKLATEKYLPLSPILEGFVNLKENPDYTKELLHETDRICRRHPRDLHKGQSLLAVHSGAAPKHVLLLSLGGNKNLVKVPHKGDYPYIMNERMLGSYIKDETEKDKVRLPKDEFTCLTL